MWCPIFRDWDWKQIVLFRPKVAIGACIDHVCYVESNLAYCTSEMRA